MLKENYFCFSSRHKKIVCLFCIPVLLVFLAASTLKKEPKGKFKFCFDDEVADTSKRFSNFLLQLDMSKRTFQYEILTESLSTRSKWVNYIFISGKIKKKAENEYVFTSLVHNEKSKSSGHVFDEKKSEVPEKLDFNFKTHSLQDLSTRRIINFFRCESFPSDSLHLFYEHWKN